MAISTNDNKIKEYFQNKKNLLKLHLINNFNAVKEENDHSNAQSKNFVNLSFNSNSCKLEKDTEDILRFNSEYAQFNYKNRNFEERKSLFSKNMSYDFTNTCKHFRNTSISKEGKWIKRKNYFKRAKL